MAVLSDKINFRIRKLMHVVLRGNMLRSFLGAVLGAAVCTGIYICFVNSLGADTFKGC